MLRFVFLLFFLPLTALAQPLKYKDELVFELHSGQECLNKSFFKCTNKKLSASILSGSVGDFQINGVFKLSGIKGKLGGQIWLMLNDFLWVGGESITDLHLDADHEVFVSLDILKKDWHFYPYIAFHMASETFSALGVKIYFKETSSLGFEGKLTKKKSFEFMFSLGFAIKDGQVEKVKNLFMNKE